MNNSKMTREDDAKVAEIVEPKPDLPGEETRAMLHREFIRGDRLYSLGKAWKLIFEYVTKRDEPKWVPRPFTTAPTFESDGIVLEWVQGQENEMKRNKFAMALFEIFHPGTHSSPLSSYGLFLDYYKPGMYASALLEVVK